MEADGQKITVDKIEGLVYSRLQNWSLFLERINSIDDGEGGIDDIDFLLEFEQEEEQSLDNSDFATSDTEAEESAVEEDEDFLKDVTNLLTQTLNNNNRNIDMSALDNKLCCTTTLGSINTMEMQDVLNETKPILHEQQRRWQQAGFEPIVNTFDLQQIEESVGGWLKQHHSEALNSTNLQQQKMSQKNCCCQHDSDTESLQSIDTARYIRSCRKHCASTCATKTTTIKTYCKVKNQIRSKLRQRFADCAENDEQLWHELRKQRQRPKHTNNTKHVEQPAQTQRSSKKQRRKLLRKYRACDSSYDLSSSDEDAAQLLYAQRRIFKRRAFVKSSLCCRAYRCRHGRHLHAVSSSSSYSFTNSSSCTSAKDDTPANKLGQKLGKISAAKQTQRKRYLPMPSMNQHNVQVLSNGDTTDRSISKGVKNLKLDKTFTCKDLSSNNGKESSSTIKATQADKLHKKLFMGIEQLSQNRQPNLYEKVLLAKNLSNKKKESTATMTKKQAERLHNGSFLNIEQPTNSKTDKLIKTASSAKKPQKNGKTNKIAANADSAGNAAMNNGYCSSELDETYQQELQKALKFSKELYMHEQLKSAASKVKPMQQSAVLNDIAKPSPKPKPRYKQIQSNSNNNNSNVTPKKRRRIKFLHDSDDDDVTVKKSPESTFLADAKNIYNSTALSNHTAIAGRQIYKNSEANQSSGSSDCFIVSSTTMCDDGKNTPKSSLNNASNKDAQNTTSKRILLYTPSANGEFTLTQKQLSEVIDDRRARKFLKYYPGQLSFDGKKPVYFFPSKKLLEDSAITTGSDSDITELFGAFGDVHECDD